MDVVQMGLLMQKVQIMMVADVYSLNMAVVQMEKIRQKGRDFMVRKYLP